MTDTLKVNTTIHAPEADVYALLCDVEDYGEYSDYIQDVIRHGDGGPGTEYGITLSWSRISYTVWFRVIDRDPPDRIAWRVVDDLDAHGAWQLEPTTVDDPEADHATHVTLTARFDPDTANDDALSLPPLVSVSTVVEQVRPLVEREAERVLDRVVADLEDDPRRATLIIHTRHDAE